MSRQGHVWLHSVLAAGLMVMVAGPLAAAERGGGLRQQPLVSPPALGTAQPPRGISGPSRSQSPPESRPRPDSLSITHRGTRYLVNGGRWYEQRGDKLLPVPAPEGVLVPELPPGYSMRWVGGVPYFFSDGLYYVWRERKRSYEILQTPPSGESAQSATPSSPAPIREPVQAP